MEKCFFQRKRFPWKQSCGNAECSSDRPAKKTLRKIRKKVGINPIKNLESNEVPTTVLENSCRKPEMSPSKLQNTIWKVFFSEKMLHMRTILWTRRVQFWQTDQYIFAWIPKKLAQIRLKNLETKEVPTTVMENICPKTWKVSA